MSRVIVMLMLAATVAATAQAAPRTPADEPLLDWSAWQKYRQTVHHPAGVTKPADLVRARANIERYPWARSYVGALSGSADNAVKRVDGAFLVQMIPTDTPGDTLFTPCPACRDLGKPAHMHGEYSWNASDPDKLTCRICGTVYPNDKYPEDLVFKTKYGGGQTIQFYGGKPFSLFGFATRPSFTAKMRCHKVLYAMSLCRQLAEAYALTQKPEYARAARLLLLRFADVYPNWLVHVGYGEYADMDPHLAALNVNGLPEDEITANPGGPDRRLHSGYWQGGRATGTGMEAGFVRSAVEAYGFVCEAKDNGQPLFSDAERLHIEKDLLLESTVLLVADKAVNNKSVGNATAVALVGMSMGHPEMVRFGLDVFMRTVDGWFLKDGGTSESYSYATMTLSGIESLGQAFRGYSDPPGYQDAQGQRIDKLDLYHDTAYKRVWEAMFNGLQGNLCYPPLADGHRTTSLGSTFVELMADNYPDNLQYLALLKETAGKDLSGGDRGHAIYYREPGREQVETPPLSLPDVVFPVLQFGYLRSGETGRDSCLVLSASDWGGHHHLDSLSLYYWQQGQELLSDLGYLWDHAQAVMTRRTFAHNTVMVDGQEQLTTGRGGKFGLFAPNGPIKVMEADSQAYKQATLYRRTVAQVEHEPGRQYVLDIFRVQGGKQHDYIFHGPNTNCEVAMPPPTAQTATTRRVRFCIRLGLQRAGTEIMVDDVSIVGPEGELARTLSAAELDANGKLVAWGLYHGDGKEEFGQAKVGHTDQASAQLKAIEPGKEMMNVALIIGESDGYTGPKSYEATLGATYKVSFWLRGKAPAVAVSALYWPDNPSDPGQRAYAPIKGFEAVQATDQWVKWEGELVLGKPDELANVRRSDAAAPWRITWQMPDGGRFITNWVNNAGGAILIGAVLPYVIRRQPAGAAPTVYVTTFEGCRPGQELVQAVEPLAVPPDQQGNAVAVKVRTPRGNDYFVSCLESKPLTLTTPDGPLQMDGRFAALSVRDGKVAAFSLVEGKLLQLNGRTITGQ